ncbi:sigma-70 family RNA polymerase sigma factor [Prevotella disiens]|uniref:RNA polymerase subunit sigma n=1 Tax=Prevotella disiens TaxID=28130 RepID=A0A3E4QJ15_9BACT|nr:sigma-70 family RNA polymerase sigma factor [Prevotella disiens]RGK96474.1 RNA polymerase subunit sigma [Prevotella disiens]
MATNEKYIKDIANEQLLSDKEEQELAKQIKIGDAKALEKLTKSNLKFVVSIAHQYKNRGLGEDDLISEGNIGMMYAAQKFDGTKGTRFVKFAAPYIRKAMEEAINEQLETFKVQNKDEKKPRKRTTHRISIDQPIPAGSNGTFTLQTILENANSQHADENLTKQIVREEIKKAMSVLDARQRKVISLLYAIKDEEAYTMQETADIMDIKRERVRQIRNKALRKLKKQINKGKL